jgi:hypothetical protein
VQVGDVGDAAHQERGAVWRAQAPGAALVKIIGIWAVGTGQGGGSSQPMRTGRRWDIVRHEQRLERIRNLSALPNAARSGFSPLSTADGMPDGTTWGRGW